MRKEEKEKEWEKMSRKMDEPELMDETDLRIMQALSDELSDITASEELIARTLRAAEEQKAAGKERNENGLKVAEEEKRQRGAEENRQEKEQKSAERSREKTEQRHGGENRKKKARVYRIWAGTLTAAAALLIVVLGVGAMQFGKKDASNGYSGSAANESMPNESMTDSASGGLPGSMDNSTMNEPAADLNEAAKGEWEDIFSDGNSYEINDFHGSEIQDSKMPDRNETESADMTNEAEGSLDEEEPLPDREPVQETTQEGEENKDLWLYGELLAAFDAYGEAPEHGSAGEIKGDARSISWQSDGRTLSCVIYQEDYRIAAALEENGVRREIVLENWAYAQELWELAGEE